MKQGLRRNFFTSLLLLASLALGGCAVNPATGEQSFTGFMSPAQEAKIGRQEHPKILKQFGGAYDDRKVVDYVVGIGRALAAKSEMPNLEFTFTVLNTEQVNAFALPGGYVYVTRGLIALAGSEAELAGVIAHEIGHVTARHTAQRYSRGMAVGLGAAILGAVVNAPGVGNLANLGADLYLKSFSREQEFEADLLGVRYMARSGYEVDAMAGFLAKMEGHKKLEDTLRGKTAAGPGVDFFSTHPRTPDRVARAISQARLVRRPGARRGRVDYMSKIDGLLYGSDPKEGLILGRVFVHPGLRIRFEVPRGFRLFNERRQVTAHGPQGALIVFDMAGKPQAGPLSAYMRQVWAANLSLSPIAALSVNGMEGVTATTRVKRRSGSFDLRLVAVRRSPKQIFRLAFLTPPGITQRLSLDLRRTTFSLRTLTAAEAAGQKALRLRVTAVGAGETVQDFARRMVFEDLREARFRALNGLGPTARLRPGQLVKIVTE